MSYMNIKVMQIINQIFIKKISRKSNDQKSG